MLYVLNTSEANNNVEFEVPGASVKIDSVSQELATEYTPTELIKEKAVGEPHTILYSVGKNNPTGDNPQNPSEDPQFKNWEYSFQKWIIENKTIKTEEPKEKDDIHTLSSKPIIAIDSPRNGELILKGRLVSGRVSSKFKIKEISLFIDDVFIENQPKPQFSFYAPESLKIGDHTIKIKAYDIVGNSSEASLLVIVNN